MDAVRKKAQELANAILESQSTNALWPLRLRLITMQLL